MMIASRQRSSLVVVEDDREPAAVGTCRAAVFGGCDHGLGIHRPRTGRAVVVAVLVGTLPVEVDDLAWLKGHVSRNTNVAEVGPAAAGGLWRVDDTPALLGVPFTYRARCRHHLIMHRPLQAGSLIVGHRGDAGLGVAGPTANAALTRLKQAHRGQPEGRSGVNFWGCFAEVATDLLSRCGLQQWGAPV